MILEMKNICKSYFQGDLEFPILKDINFSVDEGEYVAIMGPSGSGKSTLMNIIGCLDQSTSGSYLLDGKAIETYKDRELADMRNRYIGFVFQTYNLLPKQSALDNVALPLQYAGYPRKLRKDKCLKALDMVGLADKANSKPNQLSGGQKQRVAIARAIINDPKILLADEPTGALDSKSGVQVMKLFRELNDKGVTIVMITHSEEIAGYADRVIRIIDGQIYDGKGPMTADPETEGGAQDD